jgi:hypothetical protein
MRPTFWKEAASFIEAPPNLNIFLMIFDLIDDDNFIGGFWASRRALFALRAEAHGRAPLTGAPSGYPLHHLRWFRYYALRGRLKPFLSLRPLFHSEH